MQQQQEWERRKTYLIRSLFVDLPPLSPIPEEDSPSQVSTRPYSPLPELIIERTVPTNKHDEPEEFYEELERKMKKLYRKLFLNDDASSLDEADELSHYYGLVDRYSDKEAAVYSEFERLTHDEDSLDPSSHINLRLLGDHGSTTFGDSVNDQDMVKEQHDPIEVEHDGVKGTPSIRVQDPLGIVQESSKVDQSVMYLESSSPETNGVQIVTCEAQVHREDSKGSVEEEESPSFILETARSRAVTKRGEFIDIRISVLEKDDSNVNGENRGSIPVITLDSSESGSNNTLEIMRHYNIRRHSMGSIRLSDAHGRLSSSSNVNLTRSRSLDPEFEAYGRTATSDVKLTEEVHADSADHTPGGQLEVWTDLGTESEMEVSEAMASGVAASTPKSTPQRESKSRSKSRSSREAESPSKLNIPSPAQSTSTLITNRSTPKGRFKSKTPSKDSSPHSVSLSMTSDNEEVDKLNTAVITRSLTVSSDAEYEFDEVHSARKSSFPSDVGVKRKSTVRSERGGEKRTRVSMGEISWNELKNNFFVGVPTVYKLCSCADHACEEQ